MSDLGNSSTMSSPVHAKPLLKIHSLGELHVSDSGEAVRILKLAPPVKHHTLCKRGFPEALTINFLLTEGTVYLHSPSKSVLLRDRLKSLFDVVFAQDPKCCIGPLFISYFWPTDYANLQLSFLEVHTEYCA